MSILKLNLTERANQSLRRGHDRDDDDATEPHSVAARMSPSRVGRRLGSTEILLVVCDHLSSTSACIRVPVRVLIAGFNSQGRTCAGVFIPSRSNGTNLAQLLAHLHLPGTVP